MQLLALALLFGWAEQGAGDGPQAQMPFFGSWMAAEVRWISSGDPSRSL